MSIKRIEIVRAHINLVSPFRTSFGTEVDRELLYVHVIGDDEEGWGECVAMAAPLYSSEYVDGCEEVIKRYLIPLVTPTMTAHEFVIAAASIRGNFMAKAAVEAALLDYQLRCTRLSLAGFLGATQTRVASGVSVGIQPDIDTLLGVVEGYRKDGYVRIKLKIEPGYDIDRVRAVRQTFGDEMLLQVDANAAYTVDDAAHLARLDEFNLLLMSRLFQRKTLLATWS